MHWKCIAWTDESLVLTVQAGGGSVMLWGMFSWHILCHFNIFQKPKLFSIFADYMHPLWKKFTHFIMITSSMLKLCIHDNKSNVLWRPFQWSALNQIEHLWDVVMKFFFLFSLHIDKRPFIQKKSPTGKHIHHTTKEFWFPLTLVMDENLSSLTIFPFFPHSLRLSFSVVLSKNLPTRRKKKICLTVLLPDKVYIFRLRS